LRLAGQSVRGDNKPPELGPVDLVRINIAEVLEGKKWNE